MNKFEQFEDLGSLEKIITAMGLMSNEFLFIADVKRRQWRVLSIGTILQKLFDIEGQETLDADIIVKKMFAEDQIKTLRTLRSVMIRYWLRYRKRDDSIVFELDTNIKFTEDKSLPIHLTVLPLSKEDGKEDYIVVAGSFLTCGFQGQLLARHFSGLPTMIYDPETDWTPFKVPVMSKIENQVLVLSIQGFQLKEISETLNTSENTIKGVKKRIFKKLGVDNIAAAITRSLNLRII